MPAAHSFDPTEKGYEKGWRPDEDAAECAQCGQPFHFVRRRHHCRRCGEIFCNDCSSERHVPYGDANEEPQRVCDACARKIKQETADPLWHVLGPVLAPQLYHAMARHGDTEALAALSPGRRTEVFDAVGVPRIYRAELSRRLDERLSQHATRPRSPARPGSLSPSRSPGPHAGATSPPVGVPPARPGSISPRPAHGASASPAARDADLEQLTDQRKEECEAIQLSCEWLRQCLDELERQRRVDEEREGPLEQMHEEINAYQAAGQRQLEEQRRRAAAAKYAGEAVARTAAGRRAAWEDGSDSSTQCALCGVRYTFTRRRHHCRVCFLSVCAACSRCRNRRGDRRCDHCAASGLLSASGMSPWLLRVKDDEHAHLAVAGMLRRAEARLRDAGLFGALGDAQPSGISNASLHSPQEEGRSRAVSIPGFARQPSAAGTPQGMRQASLSDELKYRPEEPLHTPSRGGPRGRDAGRSILDRRVDEVCRRSRSGTPPRRLGGSYGSRPATPSGRGLWHDARSE
eukprot:TRINITY_DN15310_c0_g1_i2.p1 TRINITY_DN15310_c0_g1~~TRINITY_DN15310_c0_g1_i2.p1  ORF type:complete len:518 (+),score=96.91 TRINITY_DN15310_c0_g1_i2:86-1639(+)